MQNKLRDPVRGKPVGSTTGEITNLIILSKVAAFRIRVADQQKAASIKIQMKNFKAMPEPPARAITVARLTTDEGAARRIQDGLVEICDGERVAISIAQELDGRWSLALHFCDSPDEIAVRALIASAAGKAASQELARALAQDLIFEVLAPTDWVRKSLEGLRPVDAGRFLVHGAHDRGRVGVNRIAIQIEAGLAFGTGHHGSTRGCLLALDRIMKPESRRRRTAGNAIAPRLTSNRLTRKRAAVLDIGTGTGVLAIAAAKALRRPVVASDIDARAVAIARDNARINRAAAGVEVVHAAGVGARRFLERSPFALIFANILLDPLEELATPIAKLVAPNGRVVLSGLLNAQGAAALASYRARGLMLTQRICLAGWTTLLLVRPSRGRTRAPRETRRLREHCAPCRPANRLRSCSKPASSRSRIPPNRRRAGRALRRCAPSSRAAI